MRMKAMLQGSVVLSNSYLKKHGTNIERNCKRRMWEYEGYDLEEQINKQKNKSQQKQATYLVIERCVLEYKTYLAE
jgi:hypothetical protein